MERRCPAVPFSHCVASIMPRLCSLRKQQPSIGYQAVIVESDLDAVGLLKW